jgi:hypothetical protein
LKLYRRTTRVLEVLDNDLVFLPCYQADSASVGSWTVYRPIVNQLLTVNLSVENV